MNRDTGQWNTTVTGPANPDVVRLNGILDAMRAQSLISAQLRLLAFGHSNGGQFSHFSTNAVNWAAVSISCVQGSESAARTYTGPVVWWMGKNDDHPQVGAAGVRTSQARYELHANRGFHARHMTTASLPRFRDNSKAHTPAMSS